MGSGSWAQAPGPGSGTSDAARASQTSHMGTGADGGIVSTPVQVRLGGVLPGLLRISLWSGAAATVGARSGDGWGRGSGSGYGCAAASEPGIALATPYESANAATTLAATGNAPGAAASSEAASTGGRLPDMQHVLLLPSDWAEAAAELSSLAAAGICLDDVAHDLAALLEVLSWSGGMRGVAPDTFIPLQTVWEAVAFGVKVGLRGGAASLTLEVTLQKRLAQLE